MTLCPVFSCIKWKYHDQTLRPDKASAATTGGTYQRILKTLESNHTDNKRIVSTTVIIHMTMILIRILT